MDPSDHGEAEVFADTQTQQAERVVLPTTHSSSAAPGYADPFEVHYGLEADAGDSSLEDDGDGGFAEAPGGAAAGAGAPQQMANWADLLPADEELMFWGAEIRISEFRAQASAFLLEWAPPGYDAPGPGGFYVHQMQRLLAANLRDLEVDLTHMQMANVDLFDTTVAFPLEALPVLAEQANAALAEAARGAEAYALPAGGQQLPELSVRVCNMPGSNAIRDLGPKDIGRIVSVQGMVVRVTKLLPELRTATFRCRECLKPEYEPEERGRVNEPTRCTHCGSTLAFELQHNQCQFVDKQFVRVQEAPDRTPDGETPSSLSITLYSSLVDTVVPGDRVIITGIHRATPVRVSGNSAVLRSVFKTFVEATHIQKTTKGKRAKPADGGCSADSFCAIYDQEDEREVERLEAQMEHAEAETVDQIHLASRHPGIYEILVRSLAPSIHGQEDVKMGVLCQLFGGTQKRFVMSSARSEINILLCGDPGVAKSQILSHVNGIASRGIYTSGKGSSSVGLTAFLVRDPDTGEFVLESGALVLSDRGICCIDEFDKMDDSTRSVLHEVMEQQTVSIAKAGIICTLNARASILAAANPKDSSWNKSLNILQNLDISSTLLSRFDLIYLLLDLKDKDLDRRLALHICQMYTASTIRGDAPGAGGAGPQGEGSQRLQSKLFTLQAGAEVMSLDALSKYIAYAKAKVKPKLTKDAESAIVKAYLAMRRKRGSRNVVTATTRQLEAMIRLAEAHAKMRLSSEVTTNDVHSAQKLIETALRDSCTDPSTGMLISAVGDTHTGISTHSVVKALLELAGKKKWAGQAVPLEEVQTELINIIGRAVSRADMMDGVTVLVSREQAGPIVDGNLPFL